MHIPEQKTQFWFMLKKTTKTTNKEISFTFMKMLHCFEIPPDLLSSKLSFLIFIYNYIQNYYHMTQFRYNKTFRHTNHKKYTSIPQISLFSFVGGGKQNWSFKVTWYAWSLPHLNLLHILKHLYKWQNIGQKLLQ